MLLEEDMITCGVDFEPQRQPDTDELPHQRMCDHCRADIFNRRFHCARCRPPEGVDVCLQCYPVWADSAEHRGHKAVLVERWSHRGLADVLATAEQLLKEPLG